MASGDEPLTRERLQRWVAELPELVASPAWKDSTDLQCATLAVLDRMGPLAGPLATKRARAIIQAGLGWDDERFGHLLRLPSVRQQRRALRAAPPLGHQRLGGEELYPQDDSWLGRYLLYNQGNEVPTAWNFWCGLVCLAAACRRNVYLDWGNHEVWPNLYLVIVAPTAARKSTAINTAAGLLSRANRQLDTAGASPYHQLYVSPERCTPEAFIEDIRELDIQHTNPPGVTPPVEMSMRRAQGLIRADELVTLCGKNTHNPGGWIELLTALYDSQEVWIDKTISRGSAIMREVALSFMVGSTADWIRDGVTESMFAGGFMGRCIFVTRPPGAREVHRAQALDPIAAEALAADLVTYSRLEQREFGVTTESLEWHRQWYHANKELQRTQGDSRMQFYYFRKEQHLLKVAMLLAVSAGRLHVEVDDLELANKALCLEELALPGIFAQMVESKGSQSLSKVVEVLKGAGGKMRHSELLRRMVHHCGDARSFKDLMETLVSMGTVRRNVVEVQRGTVVWELVDHAPQRSGRVLSVVES